jgi:hypothetical protein
MSCGGDGMGAFSFSVWIEKYVSIFKRHPGIVVYSIPDPFLKNSRQGYIKCQRSLSSVDF